MSTVITAPARAHAPGAYDRIFYSSMAILAALIVFAGFAPTFYLRSYFGGPRTITGATALSPLAIVHGLVFTTWVVLFIAQTALIAGRRIAVHRRLGYAGAGLGGVMIVLGILTAIAAGQRGSAPDGFTPRTFLIVPLGDMLLFAVFLALAVRERRNKEAHKRLMLVAYVNLLIAAVARLPGVGPVGPFLTIGFIVIFIAYDFVSRGKVHPVYLWGGAIFALSLPGRIALAQTPMWQAFAARLIG